MNSLYTTKPSIVFVHGLWADVAKRMGAATTEVDSSHVPMLSNPKLVLDLIRKAAHAVQKSANARSELGGRMTKATQEKKNKDLLLDGFDALFNRRDFETAKRYWSSQLHSAQRSHSSRTGRSLQSCEGAAARNEVPEQHHRGGR